MEISDFVYHRPKTVEEACELGHECPDARFLAGGTELLILLKQKRLETLRIIALSELTDLAQISMDDQYLRVGALATLSQIAHSSLIRDEFAPLSEAVLTMAGEQIRNRATIGGNFCAAVPCADTPPICIVAGAKVRLVGLEGQRVIPAEDFFAGPRRNVLQPGELLCEILVPRQPKNSGATYERFSRRGAMTLAVAGVAACLQLAGEQISHARVCFSSVAPVPLLARKTGELLDSELVCDELFERAAQLAATEARPIADVRGTLEFRYALVHALTRRALQRAAARAFGHGEANICGKA